MDLERSIKFMFKDEDWLKKLLIGGIVNVVPIVNFAGLGYGVKTQANIIKGEETPLPEWSEFGDFFVKGLLVFVAGLVYYLPLILLSCVMGVIGNALYAGGSDAAALGNLFSVCIGLISFLYGLFAGVILPAGVTMYAVTDEFASMFRFGEIFRFIGQNLGNYVIAILITMVASTVAGLVGGLVCGIGLLLTVPWSYLVIAHLFAQVYIESDIVEATAVEEV